MDAQQINLEAAQKRAEISNKTYPQLRAWIYDYARRHNQKVVDLIPNQRKLTITTFAYNKIFEWIRAQYAALHARIEERQKEERLARKMERRRQKEEQKRAELERAHAVFEQFTPQLNRRDNEIQLRAMVDELFPDARTALAGEGEDAIQRFGYDVYNPWFIENRLKRVQIPPGHMLFMNRSRKDVFDFKRATFMPNKPSWFVWVDSDYNMWTYRHEDAPEYTVPFFAYIRPEYSDYEFEDNNYTLEMYIVNAKPQTMEFNRVGYNVFTPVDEKNCLVRILSPYVPENKRQIFDYITKDLVHKEGAPAYINSVAIHNMAMLLRVKISLYSPFAAITGTPTQVVGAKGNKRDFRIMVQNKHARIIAPNIINKVEYITAANIAELAASPKLSGIIEPKDAFPLAGLSNTPFAFFNEYAPDTPTISALTLVDSLKTTRSDSAEMTIYKFLRPSAITGIPSDDTNPALFSKTNPSSVFLYDFIRKNGIVQPPKYVQELAALAGRPFGTGWFAPTYPNMHTTEIDQNASYASFEFSPYYEGVPMGNWVKVAGAPAPQLDPELKPAFVEIRAVRLINETKYARVYFEAMARLRTNYSVVTYPEYKRYAEMFEVEAVNTVYATFKRVGIYDDLNKLAARMIEAAPEEEHGAIPLYIKSTRNMFTGKLIAGGLDTYKSDKIITTTDQHEFEIMLAEYQKIHNTMPRVEISQLPNSNFTTYKIFTTVDKFGSRYPHIYAYITAVSRLAILEKVTQLTTSGFKVVRVHVDAINVVGRYTVKKINKIAAAIPDIGVNPGQFKIVPGKYLPESKYEANLPIAGDTLDVTYSDALPEPEGYPAAAKLAIIGPGGTGKTYVATNFLSGESPSGRALYLTPTRELRQELRAALTRVNKPASDCVCLEGIRRAIFADYRTKAEGKAPIPRYQELLRDVRANYTHVIIDEFVKTDGADLATVINWFSQHYFNIIMMGDYNQTTFAKEGGFTVRKNTLEKWGFNLYADPRNARAPNKPMRHSYEWGSYLDTLAELSSEDQIASLVENAAKWGIRIVDKDHPIEPAALIYCGKWASIHAYNSKVVAENTIVRVRDIKTGVITPYLPEHKPYIWNKKEFSEQAPAGKKYLINHAISVDCVQGSTVENPLQYIHVDSLKNRWGAIYTAITRSRTPQQIIIIM